MGHIDHPYNVIADAGQSTCRSQQPNSDKYIYQGGIKISDSLF